MGMTKAERAVLKAAKQLDKDIEQAWYKQAFGVQVNIMDIGKIFAFCREQVNAGVPLTNAIDAAIAKWRKN